MAKRCVISERHRLGTAVDIVCYHKAENHVVLVELKCGYDCGRTAAAVQNGKECKMRGPLSGASDCNVHRHLSQLAVTRHLFCNEHATIKKLGDLGIEKDIKGLLMYANDEGVEFFELGDWWQKKSGKVLEWL